MVVQLQLGSVSKWLREVHLFIFHLNSFQIIGIAIKVNPESLAPCLLHTNDTISVINHYRAIAFVVQHLLFFASYEFRSNN